MSTTPFKVGDYFILDINYNTKRLGKVEELLYNDSKEKIIRYNVIYFPEETKGGRKPHNSLNEVYLTDVMAREYYYNIKQKVEIITLEEYIKRKCNQKTKNVFFYRQKYSYVDHSYLPDLDYTCYCDKLFNPDEEYQQCSKCKECFHFQCYLQSGMTKCYNELCNNIIENQYSTYQFNLEKKKASDNSMTLLGTKHNRDEEEGINNANSNDNERNKNNKILNYSNTKQKEKYSNIPEPNRINLVSLTEQIEQKHSEQSKSYTENEKVRQNARDNILFTLLYGIEELKSTSTDDGNKLKLNRDTSELSEDNIQNDELTLKYCESLSRDIEGCIFSTNKYEINHYYKKKLRTLYMYLMHEENSELRIAILSKEITSKKLIGMSSDELAPSSFIKDRLEKQNKYFKEQVLIEETAPVITKTHKGEAILVMEDNNKINEANVFIPFQVINKKKIVDDDEGIGYDSYDDYMRDNNNNNNNNNNNVDCNLSPEKIYEKEEGCLDRIISIRYNTMSKAKLEFLKSLEKYTKEKMEKELNENVLNLLQEKTVILLNKEREKYKTDIII